LVEELLLRGLYVERQQYLDAFELKRERLSIEQQYGLRAFIGAGRLRAQRQALSDLDGGTVRSIGIDRSIDPQESGAPEIEAAGRQRDLEELLSRIGRNDYKRIVIHGASGVGKSSLVKAVHAAITAERPGALALIEIHREDIGGLPALLAELRPSPRRFVLFCDDLSFDAGETAFKSLKAVLEGGIEGRPDNVIFYATSNRRHLMPREMIDNERATAINPGEAVEECVHRRTDFCAAKSPLGHPCAL